MIQQAVWVYLRFTLSYRHVEDLLAERGLDISYESVRRWVLKFGAAVYARGLRGAATTTPIPRAALLASATRLLATVSYSVAYARRSRAAVSLRL